MPKKTVMIVDDSEADQFLAVITIENLEEEITVLQAYDGQEALDILDGLSAQPDFIFLDINMPVMNGHEFLREYSNREMQASVVVMLTSSLQERDKERSLAYQCVKEYFTKPLEESDLERILRV